MHIASPECVAPGVSAAHVSPVQTASADSITIRHCASTADYVAVYELQAETWGREAGVLVSTPILKVSQRVGGVTAGAFAADGALLGFVFGLTGPQRGRLVHWSDMLAVRPEARDLGIGRRLKVFQRDACREMGVEAIQWTYDPLVARNAHLNLMRLGAWPVEYVPDMYADSDSPLHVGFGTDRFVVEWPAHDACTIRGDALAVDAESAIPLSDGTALAVSLLASEPALVSVPIPRDIHAVAAADSSSARRWRETTRAAFESALSAGYRACGVTTNDAGSAYLFARPDLAATLFSLDRPTS
jgi:chorismate synthase